MKALTFYWFMVTLLSNPFQVTWFCYGALDSMKV